MMIASVTKSVSVSCAHRLYNHDLSDQDKQRIYGKCTSIHGHNYTISVTWTGPIDSNGMVVNLATAKQVLVDEVVSQIDHKCLDDLPFFEGRPSTTENLCVFIAERIQQFQWASARVSAVTVRETDNNTFTVSI